MEAELRRMWVNWIDNYMYRLEFSRRLVRGVMARFSQIKRTQNKAHEKKIRKNKKKWSNLLNRSEQELYFDLKEKSSAQCSNELNL